MLGLVTTSSAFAQTAPPVSAPLIPREVLFGNPQRSGAKVSPDGTSLGFVAPRDGVLNVWVQPLVDGKPSGEPKPLTQSTTRPIRQWNFVPGSSQIVYLQDRGGDENFQIFAVDLASGAETCLTPWPGTRASILATDADHPHQVLVSVNNRDPAMFDAWRIDTRTGKGEMVFKNEGGWISMLPDKDWNVRLVTRMLPDGSLEAQMRETAAGEWKPFASWTFENSASSSPFVIAKDGKSVFVLDTSRTEAKNTGGLYEVTFAPKGEGQQWRLIETDPRCEPGDTLIDPKTNRPQAIAFEYLRSEWTPIDPAIAPDLATLKKVADGDFIITSRSDDDRYWTVAFVRDDGPVETYLYDRTSKNASFLFVSNDTLRGLPLVKMTPEVIKSRDGLDLVSYLTLPKGFVPGSSKPVPMVLFVHGGPWARDSWGYNPYHQWLANRGYAVLSVNFRGSTGFGKDFLNAGNRQWAAKMHDDLIDASNWAVAKGIADPKKIAIMGGSYGGYAALAGLTFTPDFFACAVDIVGPSNIVTLLQSIPPYWGPMKAMFEQRVGSLDDEKYLASISPITFVDRIQRPLLIGQGANDPRVKQAESDQIVAAMKKRNIPVTYVLFPDEGHGFARPENNMAFSAVTEAFLAKHLGGQYEPIGNDVSESSAQIPAGADLVPGLTK
ncbi:MAG: S9 family peptidase [Phycisphaerae bacterium]|nr:S9 family peptidase [Phycisphaerae bacterium]